jgi:hypothetical protein
MFVIPCYPFHVGDVGVDDRITLILSDPKYTIVRVSAERQRQSGEFGGEEKRRRDGGREA